MSRVNALAVVPLEIIEDSDEPALSEAITDLRNAQHRLACAVKGVLLPKLKGLPSDADFSETHSAFDTTSLSVLLAFHSDVAPPRGPGEKLFRFNCKLKDGDE